MTREPRDAPQFYLTAPAPCPYLPAREERKVFTHLVGRRAVGLHDTLSQSGFRRSQTIAYRPACETCRACVSVRVKAAEFHPNRSFKRILSRNSDLVGALAPAHATSEQYALFRAYLDARHGDGGMADMSVYDFSLMVEDSHINTHIVEYRRRGPDTAINGRGAGPLIAACVIDQLADGLSMVYSFFDPDETDRSLGTMMILDQIAAARRRKLPHVYLGYWVDGSRKMAYKARFLPQERLGMTGWERIESLAHAL